MFNMTFYGNIDDFYTLLRLSHPDGLGLGMIRGLWAPYIHKSLCFPKSQGHNMVIFQEYQIFNFFSSQFA